MTSPPWWTTIVAACAGSALTLAATVLTAIVANHYARKRWQIDLLHQRFLEREKSLYESRLSTYAEIVKLTYKLDDLIREWHEVAASSSDLPLEQVAAANPVVDDLNRFAHIVPVISGEQVVDAFDSFLRECASLEDPISRQRIAETMGDVIVAIRHEIGADLGESMTIGQAAFRRTAAASTR